MFSKNSNPLSTLGLARAGDIYRTLNIPLIFSVLVKGYVLWRLLLKHKTIQKLSTTHLA